MLDAMAAVRAIRWSFLDEVDCGFIVLSRPDRLLFRLVDVRWRDFSNWILCRLSLTQRFANHFNVFFVMKRSLFSCVPAPHSAVDLTKAVLLPAILL